MREMKDSGIEWIGAIPNHWRVSKIKQIVRWKSVKGQPDLPVLSLYRDYGVIPKDSRDDNHNVTSLDTSGYKVVEHGDLVINKMKAWQGSLAVSEYNGIVSPAYHICKITSENICKKYLHYLLRDASYLPEYMRLSTGLRVGQWDLSFDDFKNIPFLVPPLAEQERIAAFLDAECAEIDAVLEKTRASIEEYKKLKQAVITQVVTKGVRGDRPMKDSGIEWIGDIPAEWNKDKVIRVFSVIGSGTTPKSSDENLFDSNTPWIQSGDINGENLFVTKNCVSNSAIESYSALRVYQAPYLVVAMYGASVGNLSLSMIDACVNQACCVLKKPTINLKFSFYIFKAVQDYLARKAVGGGQPNISQETIKQLWLPIPSADEQIEISNYLDEKCRSVDALIAKKQQYLTEIENYKKSLIYEYVTGKKEVKTSVLAD